MLDATAALLTYQAGIYFATGRTPGRMGNRHPTIVPYETFEASDGEFVVAVGNDEQWRRFCAATEPGRSRRRRTVRDQPRSRHQLRHAAAAARRSASGAHPRRVGVAAAARRRAVRVGARHRRGAAGSAPRSPRHDPARSITRPRDRCGSPACRSSFRRRPAAVRNAAADARPAHRCHPVEGCRVGTRGNRAIEGRRGGLTATTAIRRAGARSAGRRARLPRSARRRRFAHERAVRT